jgi:hypothetical protein
MYNDSDLQVESVFRVVDEKYFNLYKPTRYESISFKTDKGIIHELFQSDQFITVLPVNEKGKDITEEFFIHYLGPLAKEGLIDDITYLLLRNISSALTITYNKETSCVAFGKPSGKAKRVRINITGAHT